MLNVIGSLFLSLIFMFSQAVSAATEEDPWEGFNRSMFIFNDTIDGAVLKPIAKGYKAITPNPVQKGVSNFFSNLGEIGNITNNLFQGKWDETASSTFRFLINSTAGWFGIFDVASELGLKQYDEDFGQTLGYWGVSSGPYLVLPFLGPSTVRDGSGLVVEYTYIDETGMLDLNSDEKLGLLGLDVIETRARYLNAEGMIVGDRYSFIRDVYLQSRAYEVYDGNPPQKKKAADKTDSADDSWGDDSGSDSWGDETASDSWGDDSGSDSWGDETASDSWGDEPTSDSWSE
ncbi:VacJ family lipoprotein [Marinomonas rhizomae]|uniref:Phospholipid-binding lipoprotein MlaA n=1 Tax=Marinomonas rhizomae TaxID=491948 RepID=A0A366IZD9_9GAMM|nr:VacJ family lipoprotein [Marinomonas rhizomae]RBP79078.1 phospholipid-binding lipoprotein MlaA [Marinomonas rhizomae]RNF68558.1 VacJ family lipoprotein [Marinomonas rhizomae]